MFTQKHKKDQKGQKSGRKLITIGYQSSKCQILHQLAANQILESFWSSKRQLQQNRLSISARKKILLQLEPAAPAQSRAIFPEKPATAQAFQLYIQCFSMVHMDPLQPAEKSIELELLPTWLLS